MNPVGISTNSQEDPTTQPPSPTLSRRGFVSAAVGAVASGTVAAGPSKSAAQDVAPASTPGPLFVSTWKFGKPVNEAALRVLEETGSMLDAVEQGIWVAESDARNASVGLGGIPNADGVVQLDACFMVGPGHRAGSVAAIEGILHPISAARRVMEKTPHVMLVGDGAKRFALEQGVRPAELLTEERLEAWLEWRRGRRAAEGPENHDTITLLGLAHDGTIVGGCSTSGWGYKLPGRVGDSPIIGAGLYVDNEVGAAGATGLGENVMRYCASFMVVENMRAGMHPAEACTAVVKRIAKTDPKGGDLSINFIALDKKGRFGAAGTAEGFPFAVTTSSRSEVLEGTSLTGAAIGPEGGNRDN